MRGPRDHGHTGPALRTSLVIVGAWILAPTLAGCSSSTAESGSIPDPCALLNPMEIEEASGVAFQEGVFNDSISTDFQSVCDWSPVEGVFPLVQVLVSPDAATIASQRESAEAFMGAAVDVAVTGGESAYTVAGGSILGMTVDDYFVQVAFMTSDLDDVTTTTVALAEVVAAGF